MSRTSILAILAGAGIIFSGVVTSDAVAFARAVQASDETQLVRFAQQYPDSIYKNDALRLADGCIGNWVNSGCATAPIGGQGGSNVSPPSKPSYGAG